MRSKIFFEQGILKLNKDWSGWTKLTQNEQYIRFFKTIFTEKNYYPHYSDEYLADRPFEITIELSKQTTLLEQTVYSLTDLLI